MVAMPRAILHVDMDAFYASVEQADNPNLRGRPVVVGGSSARGVVAAASYEARQFGIRSAMPGRRARRLCPEAVFVKARFERYREVSEQIFSLFHEITPLVEGLSLDEAFLDLGPGPHDSEALRQRGRALKQAVHDHTGLSASVGIAANKLLAKLASDYDKPDGLVVVTPEDARRFLDPLPVRRLWGVGARTAQRLQDAGLFTAGQLRRAAPELLHQLFGPGGSELALRAAGIDHRPVKPDRVRRSISQENTFDQDHTRLETLRPIVAAQAGEVADSLKRKDLHARTVVLKLRSTGFSTITRSASLPHFTRDPEEIAAVAMELLENWARWRRQFSIRLIGVGVSGLERPQIGDELLS
ncbi:MAG: DNA polymerase IV [Wenzhouxiangella sp.]